MVNTSELTPANQSNLTRLFAWAKANVYLSLANVLAAVMALGTTIEVIDSFIHYQQLGEGVLILPFIAWLDVLFIALVASLFIRKLSGLTIYLGFFAILIIPFVGANMVIGTLQSIAGTPNYPSEATSELMQNIV